MNEGSIRVSWSIITRSQRSQLESGVKKPSQPSGSSLRTARENLFLSPQGDSMNENRSKTGSRGQNNDWKCVRYARKVSEVDVEPSFVSGRPILSSGEQFFDLELPQKTQDF